LDFSSRGRGGTADAVDGDLDLFFHVNDAVDGFLPDDRLTRHLCAQHRSQGSRLRHQDRRDRDSNAN
jgi:hypothetical protein